MNTPDQLLQILGLANYARSFIPNLGKLAGPLYSKLGKHGQRKFNDEDRKLVAQIKEEIQKIKPLRLPLESDYLVIETDGSQEGWGAILLAKPTEFKDKKTEKICRYASGKYREKSNLSSMVAQVLAIIYGLNAFELFIMGKNQITIRTDCVAIVKYHDKLHEKEDISSRIWLNFRDKLLSYGTKFVFEHIKGKDNGAA